MLKKIVVFLSFFCFSLSAEASKYFVDETGVYLVDYNTKELEDMFSELYYDAYIDLPDEEYPRIFVQAFPSDFALMEDKTERNRLFMKILIPLVLKVNDEVLEEREIIDALEFDFEQNKDFDEADMYYIDKLSEKYDVTTPFKDTRRYSKLLSALKKKVDAVPPSILVASAAIHTDWGTSRVAQKANNLYKMRVWFQEEGLEPLEDKEDGYKYKIYSSLEDSIRDYVLKINSNVNYEAFREARFISRRRGSELYGKRMDWGMVLDSNLPNYGGLLDYTLTYYKLYHIDRAKLEEEYRFEEE
ncbi:MAG: glucosaminidase domain-containing protein [Alphaproteobacteria bacterium]|nr:glucosaminidase domain-containing protein [Alphaproteobacteria bacterium]